MKPKGGKPTVYVTWIAKLLGGDSCKWAIWFKTHYWYKKFEEPTRTFDLLQWSRDHAALVQRRLAELSRDGWAVRLEDQNAFKLEGLGAILAGKPDLVGESREAVLMSDGKTGSERPSDLWQVLIYLWAWKKRFPHDQRMVSGEILYGQDDRSVPVSAERLTESVIGEIVGIIKAVSGEIPPAKVPSWNECSRCDIGPFECPQRVRIEPLAANVEEF